MYLYILTTDWSECTISINGAAQASRNLVQCWALFATHCADQRNKEQQMVLPWTMAHHDPWKTQQVVLYINALELHTSTRLH